MVHAGRTKCTIPKTFWRTTGVWGLCDDFEPRAAIRKRLSQHSLLQFASGALHSKHQLSIVEEGEREKTRSEKKAREFVAKACAAYNAVTKRANQKTETVVEFYQYLLDLWKIKRFINVRFSPGGNVRDMMKRRKMNMEIIK